MSNPKGVVPSDNSVKLFYRIITQAYNDIFATLNEQNLTDEWRQKRILNQIREIVDEADEDIKAWIKLEVPSFYEQGMFETVKDLYDEAGDVNIDLAFAHFHREAIEAISQETYHDIATAMTGLSRTGERMVALATRESILKNIITGQITGEALREIKKQIQDTLKREGITALVDRAGRSWDLQRYGEMLARTKLTQSHNAGVINKMAGGGYDLVQISSHSGSCPLCVPWQGQIVSVSGMSREYPSLFEAEGQGLFHPNCRHAITPYHAELLADTIVWDNQNGKYVKWEELSDKRKAEQLGYLDAKVYRGDGSEFQKKLRSTGGESLFGDGYYISLDKDIAKEFGNIREMNIRVKKSEILQINNQKEYEVLVRNSIRQYPNLPIEKAIPKYAKANGYKAIQGARTLDDLAGMNILDKSIIRKTYLLDKSWESTVGMRTQYLGAGIKLDGSVVLPKKMTTHIIDDFARKIRMSYDGYGDDVVEEFHNRLDGNKYRTLEQIQSDLLKTAKTLKIPMNP